MRFTASRKKGRSTFDRISAFGILLLPITFEPMKKSDKNTSAEDFVNPIDADKVAENPGLLPYAHTVGSAVIKPTREGVVRSKSLAAMEQQTNMQLDQIKKQIELLAEQANELKERKVLSEQIYSARMSFKPEINHVYHLYQNDEDQYILSMIGPGEWGGKPKFRKFINSVRLLADHTWAIEARP